MEWRFDGGMCVHFKPLIYRNIRGVFGLHEFGRSDEIHNAEAGECLHPTRQLLIEIV